MSEWIWLSSGSKLEILFKLILMHLNSIVPVGIAVFEVLSVESWFILDTKKTLEHSVSVQPVQPDDGFRSSGQYPP